MAKPLQGSLSPRILGGLILCNLIWSFHPVMGKLILADISPSYGAWARYFSAWVTYVVVALSMRVKDLWAFSPRVVLLGLLAFCYSPLTQMLGLSYSNATDNALIIALEPLMTALLAALILKDRISPSTQIGFFVAVIGFALLVELTPDRISKGIDSHLLGNIILLGSLLGEAAYSVIGRPLMDRFSAHSIFGGALTVGVAGITVALFLSEGGFHPVQASLALSWKSLLALLWLGPLGTAATYLFWMKALAHAPVPSLALTLFVQPVFGALWGTLFLGESFSLRQALGGILIIGAVIFASGASRRHAS